jgi:hypothetical protein
MKVTLRQKITVWDKLAEYFGFIETGSCKPFYDTQDIYYGGVNNEY